MLNFIVEICFIFNYISYFYFSCNLLFQFFIYSEWLNCIYVIIFYNFIIFYFLRFETILSLKFIFMSISNLLTNLKFRFWFWHFNLKIESFTINHIFTAVLPLYFQTKLTSWLFGQRVRWILLFLVFWFNWRIRQIFFLV